MVPSLKEVVIERKQEGKGREFSATHLASVTADKLWEGGAADNKSDIARPVWATFFGSDDELRAFAANLSLGRRAVVHNNNYGRRGAGFEFLKSAGFKQIWQREAEGAVVTVFLPELFLLDPGMVDPKEAKFVLLPPRDWADKQELPREEVARHARRLSLVKKLNAAPARDDWRRRDPDFKHVEPYGMDELTAMVPTAYLFAAYLDRRTRAPIPADGRFYLQLMLACLEAGHACWSHDSYSGGYRDRKFGFNIDLGFIEQGVATAGLLPGVAFKAPHEAIETLLASEIDTFFKMTRGQ